MSWGRDRWAGVGIGDGNGIECEGGIDVGLFTFWGVMC